VRHSPDQTAAIESFRRWLERPSQRFVLAGLAGTGKSTIAAAIVEAVGRDRVSVCAPTGKAAAVLRSKGHDQATTIHSLIYKPQPWCDACERPRLDDLPEDDAVHCRCEAKAGKPRVRFSRVPFLSSEFILVDEASMISGDVLDDLESYGSKLIYVGDHGQLAPVGNDPEIMRSPSAVLEQIHRQGEGSGIVVFAHDLRRGFQPIEGHIDDLEILGKGASRNALLDADIVIAGRNRTRCHLNRFLRIRRGYSGALPQVGERVICLRNDRERGLHNGLLATVTRVEPTTGLMFGKTHPLGEFDLLDDEGRTLPAIPFLPEQFGEETVRQDAPRRVGLFDFGYAITCHKSQGSEWSHVAVCDESSCFRDDAARWRYTAATRASKRLSWFL
jgi:exodeoxyribonuclease-5